VDANNETLLSRIKGRDRVYEDSIDHTYLDTLREAYDKDLTASDLNVLRYDTSALDLGSETQLRRLYELISTSVPGAGNRPST
jgi:deoxyadenosine/deoxycytidine kinase